MIIQLTSATSDTFVLLVSTTTEYISVIDGIEPTRLEKQRSKSALMIVVETAIAIE